MNEIDAATQAIIDAAKARHPAGRAVEVVDETQSVTIFLNDEEAKMLSDILSRGAGRVMIQDGGVKVCPSRSTWSLPFGRTNEPMSY
jgi:hypothetical protein